jgi:uncharacterized Zn finger protein
MQKDQFRIMRCEKCGKQRELLLQRANLMGHGLSRTYKCTVCGELQTVVSKTKTVTTTMLLTDNQPKKVPEPVHFPADE